MIDAAVKTGTTVEEQGKRYEGYMGRSTPWCSAPAARSSTRPTKVVTRSWRAAPRPRSAAQVIHKLATSPAADPSLSTADEEIGRHAFQTANGGFMLNWPYVYAAMQLDVKASCSAYP